MKSKCKHTITYTSFTADGLYSTHKYMAWFDFVNRFSHYCFAWVVVSTTFDRQQYWQNRTSKRIIIEKQRQQQTPEEEKRKRKTEIICVRFSCVLWHCIEAWYPKFEFWVWDDDRQFAKCMLNGLMCVMFSVARWMVCTASNPSQSKWIEKCGNKRLWWE